MGVVFFGQGSRGDCLRVSKIPRWVLDVGPLKGSISKDPEPPKTGFDAS